MSEVLGHKEVAITLDRYSHALPTLHTKAMARLDVMLGRGDDAIPRTLGDKGPNKGSPTPAEANEMPDPSVDRAETARLVPHTGFLVKRLMRLSRVHPVHPGDA